MGYSLHCIAEVYSSNGDYAKALDSLDRSLTIQEKIRDKSGMGYSLNTIGTVHFYNGDYDKALDYLEKSLSILKEIGLQIIELEVTTYLYLSYKQVGKNYDEEEIYILIKDAENIEFELNFRLYELLDETSYLEVAYKQIQETASEMEDELAKKFLNYPIPKTIVEEYNKVFKK